MLVIIIAFIIKSECFICVDPLTFSHALAFIHGRIRHWCSIFVRSTLLIILTVCVFPNALACIQIDEAWWAVVICIAFDAVCTPSLVVIIDLIDFCLSKAKIRSLVEVVKYIWAADTGNCGVCVRKG